MLLRQMKYLQSVVETGSFTEAAEQCFVSQSAISQAISALEHELGVKLLERKGRKFSLTPAGKYFYRRSVVLTADLEQLCRETRKQGPGRGTASVWAISAPITATSWGGPSPPSLSCTPRWSWRPSPAIMRTCTRR